MRYSAAFLFLYFGESGKDGDGSWICDGNYDDNPALGSVPRTTPPMWRVMPGSTEWPDHYPVTVQNNFALWGYQRDPATCSAGARSVLVNLISDLAF